MCTSVVAIVLLLLSPTLIYARNPNFANSPHHCPNGLKCHHGGECASGDKDHTLDHPIIISSDLPWLEELNVNGEHCTNCHDGWGGVDCGRKYEVCDSSDPEAPTCFNGSACYKMGISEETGKYGYMCDCTMAKHESGVRYAGKYCQHVQEETCDENMFCTNGGTCTSMLDLDGVHKHYVCDCPSHRGGAHCEFLLEEGFTACRLRCDRGVCAKGFKSYDDLIGSGPFPAQLAHDIISANGEHCVCPDGYTGLRCEIPVKRCGEAYKTFYGLNAEKYCYNGATCSHDDDGRPICDCNSAHTEDVSYAGMGCEHEGTSYCEPGLDQDQKDAFCTNHGECIEDPSSRHEGCVCENGWSGDLCDIQADVELPVCDLDCANGGSCRFGVKGYKDTYDELNLPVHAKKHEDGMHCSCPDGFTGLKCEVDISHCHNNGQQGAGNEHFCLNGVPCNPDDPDFSAVFKQYECQCDKGRDEISQMLAGRFCEYAVTEFCSQDTARHSHSFCTNGGKCKRFNDHRDTEHHGCCCPSGYEGEFCQLPEGTYPENTDKTWSPLEDCKNVKKPTENKARVPQKDVTFPAPPKIPGDWEDEEHVQVNPSFRVPSDDTDEESDPTLQFAEPEEEESKSNTAGVVSGVLITLFFVGLAGVAYRKRNMKEDPHQFESNWWEGDHKTQWWNPSLNPTGPPPIDPDTNIAPGFASPTPTRTKAYGDSNAGQGGGWGDGTFPSDDSPGALHDVSII